MWQVYLYLANERQGRERRVARTTPRARRWQFGRRDGASVPGQKQAVDAKAGTQVH